MCYTVGLYLRDFYFDNYQLRDGGSRWLWIPGNKLLTDRLIGVKRIQGQIYFGLKNNLATKGWSSRVLYHPMVARSFFGLKNNLATIGWFKYNSMTSLLAHTNGDFCPRIWARIPAHMATTFKHSHKYILVKWGLHTAHFYMGWIKKYPLLY